MRFYYIDTRTEKNHIKQKIEWLIKKEGVNNIFSEITICDIINRGDILYNDKKGSLHFTGKGGDLWLADFANELKWEDIKNDEIFKPKFKMGDLVLVRNSDYQYWIATRYYCYDENFHFKVYFDDCTVFFNQCIPFEGNEHLIGTIDKPTEG